MKKLPLVFVMTALLSVPALADYTPVHLPDAASVVNSFNGTFDIRAANTFLVERWWGHNRLVLMLNQANQNLSRLDQLVGALNELRGESIPLNDRYEALAAEAAEIEEGLNAIVNGPLRGGAKKRELARFYREARQKAMHVLRESVSMFSEAVDYSRVAMAEETGRLSRRIPENLVIRGADGQETSVTLAEGLRRMLQNTEDLSSLARTMSQQLTNLEGAFARVEEAQVRMEGQMQRNQEQVLAEIETLLTQQAEARAYQEAQFNRVFESIAQVTARLDAIAAQLQELRLEVISSNLSKYHYVRMNQTGIVASENGRLTEFFRALEDGIWELESRNLQVGIELEIRSLNDSVGSDAANQRVATQRVARVMAALRSGLRSDVQSHVRFTEMPYSQSEVRRLSDRGVEIKVRWTLTSRAK